MFVLLCIEIKPASIVHPLSQQFNGWLRAKLFLLRHVKVVDENNDFIFTFFWPEVTFSSSGTNFWIDKSLHLIGVGLSWKGCCEESVLWIVIIVVKLIGNVDGLARTSGSTEENVHVIFDVKIEEIIVSDWVIGWDDKFVVSDVLWNDKSRNGLRPILPYQFFHIVEHVKNVDFLWQFSAVNYWIHFVIWVNFVFSHDISAAIDQMNKEAVKLFSWSLFHGDTNWPDCAENDQVWNDIFDFFWNFCIFSTISFEVSLQNS